MPGRRGPDQLPDFIAVESLALTDRGQEARKWWSSECYDLLK
jgi:hypothetical protein